jgi:hypothetical protein
MNSLPWSSPPAPDLDSAFVHLDQAPHNGQSDDAQPALRALNLRKQNCNPAGTCLILGGRTARAIAPADQFRHQPGPDREAGGTT